MPTIFGLRRRGYTASSIRLFCDRTAVSKSDSRTTTACWSRPCATTWIRWPRSVAVLDPLKLVITNYPEGQSETCTPRNPHDPGRPARIPLTRELWIERDDFREEAPKKVPACSPATPCA